MKCHVAAAVIQSIGSLGRWYLTAQWVSLPSAVKLMQLRSLMAFTKQAKLELKKKQGKLRLFQTYMICEHSVTQFQYVCY